MTTQDLSHEEILEILASVSVIALVGASGKPDRPSHRVMAFLQNKGYRVIPVNPAMAGQMVLGERVYDSLGAIPADVTVDMVDVFRNSEAVLPIVEEAAVRGGVRVVWMQLGVVNQAAATCAQEADMRVVMDRCPAIELRD